MSRSRRSRHARRQEVHNPASSALLEPSIPLSDAQQALVPISQNAHRLLWAAIPSLQAGEVSTARTLLQQALHAGIDRQAVTRLLLGQASTHLGRAALFADRPERALRQLSHGLRLGVPGGAGLSLDLLIAEAERQERMGATREAIWKRD